eukprot:517669-Rhodomonas_salina.1
MVLRACSAVSAMVLRTSYAMSGAEIGYAATRRKSKSRDSLCLPLYGMLQTLSQYRTPHTTAPKSKTRQRMPGTKCMENVAFVV